jgi:hypothetical protein
MGLKAVGDAIFSGSETVKAMAAAVTSLEEAPRPRFLPRFLPHLRAPTALAPPATSADGQVDELESTIYRFILKHSLRQQIALLALTLASFPFLYFSLSLPKTIINHAIRDDSAAQHQILGLDFERVPYLMVLCVGFLLLVLVNGGFKYCINTFKGQLGERMLRRFRYQL